MALRWRSDLDVLKYRLAHAIPCQESLAVNRLNFHRVEEAFSKGIVVAVTLGAHTEPQLVLPDDFLVSIGTVYFPRFSGHILG